MATYISGQWKWGGIHNFSQAKTTSYATLWSVPANQMWFINYYSTDIISSGGNAAGDSINVNPISDTQYRWNKYRADTGNLQLFEYGGGSTTMGIQSVNFKHINYINPAYDFQGFNLNPPDFTSREIIDHGAIWMPGEYLQGRRYANGTGYHSWHYWYLEI